MSNHKIGKPMSTTKTNKTASDIARKTFYETLSDIVKAGMYSFENDQGDEFTLNYEDIRTALDWKKIPLYYTVMETLEENDEIGQCLAHLKVSARQNTSFTYGGLHFESNEDLLFLDITLMDVLGFSEREKIKLLYEKVMNYGKFLEYKKQFGIKKEAIA